MDLAEFIDRIPTGRLRYIGAIYTTPRLADNIVHAEFEFLNDNGALVVEGGIVKPRHVHPVQFRVECPFHEGGVQGAFVRVTSPDLGAVEGRLLMCGERLEFLGAASPDHACAVHLAFTSRDSFEVYGMVRHPKYSMAFEARPASEWERRAAKRYALSPKGP